jgi:hypothetical protein
MSAPRTTRPRQPGTRRGKTLAEKLVRDADRLMRDRPEFFVDAVNRIEKNAEEHFFVIDEVPRGWSE